MMAKGKIKSVPPYRGSTEKRVKSNSDLTFKLENQGRPSWRFSTVDKSGEFCWPENSTNLVEILNKLSCFDSMTWSQIQGDKHHLVNKNSICQSALIRLATIQKDDLIEDLFSFRLTGEARLFGLRHGDYVDLLWYDPDHKVCPSIKKHT